MPDMHPSPAAPDQPESSSSATREASAKFDKSKTRRSGGAAERSGRAGERLLAITVDADTARVVRIEQVESSGTRHELSQADREVLLNRATDGRVEDFVERAFEAGIACVLDDEPAPVADDESAQDAELRHSLLAPLIERTGVRHLMERAVLDRAILSSLIDHATTQP